MHITRVADQPADRRFLMETRQAADRQTTGRRPAGTQTAGQTGGWIDR
eukprot:COSAG01_NODE_64980_length_274_cov_1.725714_1_plen_47_part_10